jgi:ABC-2 type transport system permease protein
MLNEFQYRVNLVIQMFNSSLELAIGIAGLALVFLHTDALAGWHSNELLIVVGVYTLIGGLLQLIIQPNMERLLEGVHEGTLDFTLITPEDSQILISFTEIRIWRLVDVFLGMGVITYAVVQLGQQIRPEQAAIFALVLVCGGLIVYSFWLAISTTSFWVVRMWAFFELFQSLYQAGRWPVGIYPVWLRLGLTFLVPVAFAVTVPAEALTHRLTSQTLVLAVAMAIVALIGSRQFFKFGLKHYSGASA